MQNFGQKVTHGHLDSRLRKLCKLLGLKAYHTHDSRKSEAGFPDWVISGEIAGFHRTLFVEIKVGKDPVKDDQAIWCELLRKSDDVAFIVRDIDAFEILERMITAQLPIVFNNCKEALWLLTAKELEKFRKAGII